MAGEILSGQMSEGIDSPDVGRYAVGYVYMTGAGIDQDDVTIDGRAYELDTNATPLDGGGDVEVDINAGATAANVVAALDTDVNADGSKVVEVVNLGTLAALVADAPSTPGNYALVDNLTNGDVSAGNMVGGEARDLIPLERVAYTVTTQDTTALADGAVTGIPIGCIDLGIATANLGLYGLTIQVATGEFKSPATVGITFVTVSGTKSLIVLTDAGATLANTDVIRMLISAQ